MAKHDVVEICAGAGGQALGLHLAGFEHRIAVEVDPDAAATLAANLGDRIVGDRPIVRVGDVTSSQVWLPEDHADVALLAGGVPCPPFSIAGRQLGPADDRDLFAWAVEAAGRMRARAVMLENVPGLASPKFAPYRQAVADRLEELGYWSEWKMIDASEFGVPQYRRRFILIALRSEFAPYWRWPRREPVQRTVATTLYDLVAADGWKGAESWAIAANGIGPTIVGGSKRHGGADLGPTGAKMAWRALGVDGHGIADRPPGRQTPKGFVPRLTNEMVARLQGWFGNEYEWTFVGRKTSVYRQIGNAFPAPVARALGERLSKALNRVGEPQPLTLADAPYDPLHRALRGAATFVPESTLLSGLRITSAELRVRLQWLRHNFAVEETRINGEPAWRLGEFRAFRGDQTPVALTTTEAISLQTAM